MKKNLKLTELCRKEMSRIIGGKGNCECICSSCGCTCAEGQVYSDNSSNTSLSNMFGSHAGSSQATPKAS